ncbi:MAG TPA: VOC family protein [Polyangiaceae bacterium]|nr:VOC family protein [Polyangiaceae bacterium]
MQFASTRIITQDVQRLVGFYQQVTLIAPVWRTPEFAELSTPTYTLAIGSESTVERFYPGAARGSRNQSTILELRVADVDVEYRRLAERLDVVVQVPTTMPWGNRSLLFRDPDGNLVNLFTPVSPEAIQRHTRGT